MPGTEAPAQDEDEQMGIEDPETTEQMDTGSLE